MPKYSERNLPQCKLTTRTSLGLNMSFHCDKQTPMAWSNFSSYTSNKRKVTEPQNTNFMKKGKEIKTAKSL